MYILIGLLVAVSTYNNYQNPYSDSKRSTLNFNGDAARIQTIQSRIHPFVRVHNAAPLRAIQPPQKSVSLNSLCAVTLTY